MNSIDFHNACVRNEEYEAKRQAQLENIYFKEKSKLSGNNNNNARYIDDIYNRLSAIENRIGIIERKINTLYNFVDSNDKLFVFAPDSNVNSAVSFKLTDDQFRELMRSINK